MKNKNKSCPYKKLSVFYNSCLKTFGSHVVYEFVSHMIKCFVRVEDLSTKTTLVTAPPPKRTLVTE